MSGPQGSPQSLRDQAAQALDEGNWALAEEVSLRILAGTPSDGKARSHLALALWKLERYDDSLKEHEKAVMLAPDDELIWHDFGFVLTDLGQKAHDAGKAAEASEYLNQAVECFLRSLDLNDQTPASWTALLAIYMLTNNRNAVDRIVRDFLRVYRGEKVLRIVVEGSRLPGRTFTFRDGLDMAVSIHDGDIVCENDVLGIYGVAATFFEAYEEMCEFFAVLYEEYVESSDPLDKDGQELAARLAGMVVE